MHIFLFDDEHWLDLQPLTLTRPSSGLRVGIDTLTEKWAQALGQTPQQRAGGYLRQLFHTAIDTSDALWLNSRWLPEGELLLPLLDNLRSGQSLLNSSGELLAFRGPSQGWPDREYLITQEVLKATEALQLPVLDSMRALRQASDIFSMNGAQLRLDFARLTKGRKSEPITDACTMVYNAEQIFLEPGARVTAAILNASKGPIYVGADADVQEGAIVSGAHAICQGAVVNVGAKLRGDSTIGPWCKVGGEVSNAVLLAYSNKGHDGFLGNSVLGEWCNLGADTNVSNLKNNYSPVRVYSYRHGRSVDTGLQFCGLLMGDHSKAGINTMFNTGTVVGVAANVFGAGFPPKLVPSFSWGGAQGFELFQLNKAEEMMRRMMDRRHVPLSEAQLGVYTHLFRLAEAEAANWSQGQDN